MQFVTIQATYLPRHQKIQSREISKITDATALLGHHHGDMKATMSCASHNTTFTLWHIPTSTLLVSTNVATEVERRIDLATSSGIVMDELMLNVEQDGSLVGKQHLGPYMLIALHDM
jgi:hypothetical protein